MDDELDLSTLTFDEKVALLEEELPAPIRDFLHSPDRDATSLRLSQRYHLHADEAAAFERAYLYMLLGVNSPHDFVQDLQDAGISPEAIRGLTNDVNEEVFKRLLVKVKEEKPKISYPTESVAPKIPVLQITPSASAAPLRPPPSFNLVASNTAVHAPEPLVRTMQTDIEALQHPGSTPVRPMPHPTQMTPARSSQSASIPYTYIPSVESPKRVPAADIQVKEVQPPSVNIAPIQYSGDPYREPIQ